MLVSQLQPLLPPYLRALLLQLLQSPRPQLRPLQHKANTSISFSKPPLWISSQVVQQQLLLQVPAQVQQIWSFFATLHNSRTCVKWFKHSHTFYQLFFNRLAKPTHSYFRFDYWKRFNLLTSRFYWHVDDHSKPRSIFGNVDWRRCRGPWRCSWRRWCWSWRTICYHYSWRKRGCQ